MIQWLVILFLLMTPWHALGNSGTWPSPGTRSFASNGTTLATYNFDTNENPLSATYWTNLTGFSGLAASGGVTVNGTASDILASVYTGATFANDQWVQAKIVNPAAEAILMLLLRVQPSNTSFYGVTIKSDGYMMTYMIDGTLYDDSFQAKTIADGTIARLKVTGNVLSISFNGGSTWEAHTYTCSGLSSGKPGLAMLWPSSQAFDDFAAGDN